MNLVELLCATVISLGLGGPTPTGGNEHIACRHMEHVVQESIENKVDPAIMLALIYHCLLYTSPSPRDRQKSRMPSSA